MSYFTQMLALTVQNFLSAATGMSLLIALIRGLYRRETVLLGKFLGRYGTRHTLYFTASFIIFAIILVSQGVIQNFKPYQKVSFAPNF